MSGVAGAARSPNDEDLEALESIVSGLAIVEARVDGDAEQVTDLVALLGTERALQDVLTATEVLFEVLAIDGRHDPSEIFDAVRRRVASEQSSRTDPAAPASA